MNLLRLLLALTVLGATAPAGEGDTLNFDVLRTLAVQDMGRVKPLDTVARATVKALTGKEYAFLDDAATARRLAPSKDPVDTYLSMMFESDAWARAPLLRIRSNHLKQAMGLPLDTRLLSINDVRANDKFHELTRRVMELKRAGKNPTAEEDVKGMELLNKVNLFLSLAEGRNLLIVPASEIADKVEETHWSSLQHPEGISAEQAAALAARFGELKRAYRERNAAVFEAAAQALHDDLRAIAPHAYPNAGTIKLELQYNRLKPFHLAAGLYLSAAVAWLIALGVRRVPLTAAAWTLALAGVAVHLYGFGLRFMISGNVPVSNMYESMIFLALGVMLFGLMFEAIYRVSFYALSACIAAGVVVVMAHVLPVESGIGVLVPVLRSNFWLVIHVQTIMLSYSAFTLAWALGHVMLFQVIANPRATATFGSMCDFVYRAIQVGVLLLAAGTILGGVWANYSWGRFWGWDPKETWALICLLGYMAILHARHTNWIDNFGLAVSSVLAFMLVVMCYYGVNFVLAAGLHSYGRGSGGLLYALLYVVIDSLLVGAALWRWHAAGRPRVHSRIAVAAPATIET